MKIQALHAREVLDSRGNPTVEVEVSSENFMASAIVPSGASTGIHEALELRDKDPSRYLGKGVLKAVSNVNSIISKEMIGMDIHDHLKIDSKLLAIDGSENKENLGANAILGVSLAVLKLSAQEKNMPLYQRIHEIVQNDFPSIHNEKNFIIPTPMMNIINGGAHADSGLEIQEFMIMPTEAAKFSEALRWGAEIFHNLKKILHKKSYSTAVGDEGGFAPTLSSNIEALDTIMEAIKVAGYEGKVQLALDAAASEFFKNGSYSIDGKSLRSEELSAYYENMIKSYPIISIEDGFAEDDWAAWTHFNELCGQSVQIVGDDLFVTNTKRVKQGIEKNAANSILIKLNQIGSVIETLQTMELGKKHNMNSVISHRSGETEDTTIADFAVGTCAGQIKTGSLSRTDRIAKYNQLLRIEEALSAQCQYQGNIF